MVLSGGWIVIFTSWIHIDLEYRDGIRKLEMLRRKQVDIASTSVKVRRWIILRLCMGWRSNGMLLYIASGNSVQG